MDSSPNETAIQRIAEADPHWSGVISLRQIVGSRRILLHAGPPHEDRRKIPQLVRNSLAFACLYEGWADTWDAADALIASERVELAAAQDFKVVLPLAGVASPSMAVAAVSDSAQAAPSAYSVLNEGPTCASRLGERNRELPSHHRWLNSELADWLSDQLREPLPLYPILYRSLLEGDDGHALTFVGSKLLTDALRSRSREAISVRIDEFLRVSSTFALNVWMALAASCLARAEHVSGSTVVTRVGANGVRFGIQLAKRPGHWVTIPAPHPVGLLDGAHQHRVVARALGDSAVVDFFGLGGQAIDGSSPTYLGLRNFLPTDMVQRRERLLCAKLPGLGGRRAIVDARNAVSLQQGPMVLLGMLDEEGHAGRIGAGAVDVPVLLFESALNEQPCSPSLSEAR